MRDDDDDGDTITNVEEQSLDPGSDVGGYIVDGVLGQGGMGTVYSATHPVIGKRAAIKVLKHELSKHPAAVERFLIEARAVNQIGHHNIVDIFAFGTFRDGRSYYVMDLLTGESLRHRLKRTGTLHISEAVSVIDEIASALIAAHGKGIIHRDLKPDNVFMVSSPGRWPEARLLDWGLLKLTSAQSSISSGKYRTLAGSVMGTPVYMSPEQARASDRIDFRSDIYSLGVLSYELLAGGVPFRKGTPIDTLLAHQDEPVPSLAVRCPGLPDELVQLIEAMLAKDPAERPTLSAVRAVIKRLRGTKIPTMTAAGLEIAPLPPTPFVEPPTDSEATVASPGFVDDEGVKTIPRMQTPASGLPSYSEVSALPLPPPPGPPSEVMPGQGNPSLPYQSIQISAQTTLAGHSMPSASRPGYLTPVQGLPSQPPAYPHGSLPPQSQPVPQTAPARSMRRLIVILLVALIVTTAGIVVLVTVS